MSGSCSTKLTPVIGKNSAKMKRWIDNSESVTIRNIMLTE